jgi:hypothetical protein
MIPMEEHDSTIKTIVQIKSRICRLAVKRDKLKKSSPLWKKLQTQIDEDYWVLGHG